MNKELLLEAIATLPDDCSTDEIIATILFTESVSKGLEDFAAGRTYSTQQAKEILMNKWLT